jgi:hypothetical protein
MFDAQFRCRLHVYESVYESVYDSPYDSIHNLRLLQWSVNTFQQNSTKNKIGIGLWQEIVPRIVRRFVRKIARVHGPLDVKLLLRNNESIPYSSKPVGRSYSFTPSVNCVSVLDPFLSDVPAWVIAFLPTDVYFLQHREKERERERERGRERDKERERGRAGERESLPP